MTKLQLINSSLSKYTFDNKKIRTWVEKNCIGKTLNLFAGKNKLNIDEYRVDLSSEFSPDFVGDSYEFIKNTTIKFDSVILDPPYSYRKSIELYEGKYTSKFKLIADEILKKHIKRVISLGYHSTFMGKKRNYTLSQLCIFAHGGAQHCTIGIIEDEIP